MNESIRQTKKIKCKHMIKLSVLKSTMFMISHGFTTQSRHALGHIKYLNKKILRLHLQRTLDLTTGGSPQRSSPDPLGLGPLVPATLLTTSLGRKKCRNLKLAVSAVSPGGDPQDHRRLVFANSCNSASKSPTNDF